MTGVSWESRPGQVSVRRAKHPGDACRGTAGRNLRWVRTVCWQLGDPSDGGCEDLASSSLLSESLPCGSTEGRRASPFSGEPPTGEPCAGDPLARFGGGSDRATGCSYPYQYSLYFLDTGACHGDDPTFAGMTFNENSKEMS